MNVTHPQTGQKAVSIEDATLALWEAHKAHGNIAAELQEVQKRERAAIYDFDMAQAVFDAAVSDVRAQAPEGSSWKLAKGDEA